MVQDHPGDGAIELVVGDRERVELSLAELDLESRRGRIEALLRLVEHAFGAVDADEMSGEPDEGARHVAGPAAEVGDLEAARQQARDRALARLTGPELRSDLVPLAGHAVEELEARLGPGREHLLEPRTVGGVLGQGHEPLAQRLPQARGVVPASVLARVEVRAQVGAGPDVPLAQEGLLPQHPQVVAHPALGHPEGPGQLSPRTAPRARGGPGSSTGWGRRGP